MTLEKRKNVGSSSVVCPKYKKSRTNKTAILFISFKKIVFILIDKIYALLITSTTIADLVHSFHTIH